jgi:hypothetical protein
MTTTIETIEQIAAAMHKKFKNDECLTGQDQRQWINEIISTVVCDTVMILDGTISLEMFE